MPKLHLVAITSDHKGLVLSEHAGSQRGDLVLDIDDRLIDAIDKAQRLRARDEHHLESNALPSKREGGAEHDGPGGRLSPREIQQRLRTGESVAALARSSGVEESWIERFAAPVLAEQSRLIERARGLTFVKPRVGPSGFTLGLAVAANVVDRGVHLTMPEIESGWGCFQRQDHTWCVTFSFPSRGRRQRAEWTVDPATGELTAGNKLASDLAYREAGRRLSQPPPARAASKKAPSRRAVALGEGPAPAPLTASGLQTLPGTSEAEPTWAAPVAEPVSSASASPPKAAPVKKARPTKPKVAKTVKTIKKSAPAKKAPATKKAPVAKKSAPTPAPEAATPPVPEAEVAREAAPPPETAPAPKAASAPETAPAPKAASAPETAPAPEAVAAAEPPVETETVPPPGALGTPESAEKYESPAAPEPAAETASAPLPEPDSPGPVRLPPGVPPSREA